MTPREITKLRRYVLAKTKHFLDERSPRAHGYDHAERVRKWAVIIAKAEKSPIWLNEIIAILHDIGRGEEKHFPGVRHHELSYRLCREWFRQDRAFDVLSTQEKKIILYSLRWHWNDAADQYPEAIILRDADKLDALGAIGVKRTLEYIGSTDPAALAADIRGRYSMVYWLRTTMAQRLCAKHKLMEPIDRFKVKVLKQMITPIEV